MKKVFIYFFAFLFICFILPAILTKSEIDTSLGMNYTGKEKQEKILEEYKYNQYSMIKLLHVDTKEVEEIPLDTYLCHVVSAEMPVHFEKEALKAQAIVARTYTIYKIKHKKHDNADICDDSKCCQAWISKEDRLARWDEDKEAKWNKIQECVRETQGNVITYNNEPINAFFHSNSGGKTELPVNVWGGGSDLPYLQVVETSGEDGYSQFNSEVELTNEEIIEKLKGKYSDIKIDFNNEEDVKVLEHTNSGRVKTIKFGNHKISGTETRTLLGLRSTNFNIIKEEGKIKFVVVGYGHGVGMSQTGADSMAKNGSTAEEIVQHFYVGIKIKEVNSL